MIRNCQAQRTEFNLKATPRVNPSNVQHECKLTLRGLFESEETPLLRYAFSLTGRRAVAEEIVQEVFLRIHARWEDVQDPRAWLYRSVRNAAYNHLRNHQRETLSGEDDHTSNNGSEGEPPDAAVERMETIGAVRNMLEELSEADRELVQLKYFQGLKYRDISIQTGLSLSNIGYRLHHILKELAKKLRPLGIDEKS